MIVKIRQNFNKGEFINFDVRSFKYLIRPHLEHAAGIWSSYLRKDILKLENVQRRATKMVIRIKNLSYSDRLKILFGILDCRRKRGDLITTYKLKKGLYSAKLIKGLNINIKLHNKGLICHKP